MDHFFPRGNTGSGEAKDDFQTKGQGQGAAYGGAGMDGATGADQGMGGGAGAMGSGVAGGHEGQASAAQQTGQQQGQGEKQDWLDKGIQSAGQKFGFNVSAANADKAGDLANKQFKQHAGRNIPGVQ